MKISRLNRLTLCTLVLVMGNNYASAASDITIEGAGIQQQVHCNHNNLVVTGADNTIQASGYCNTIELTGAGSTINADSVSQIKIIGASSKVIYRSSPNKSGKAVISVTGADSYAKKQ